MLNNFDTIIPNHNIKGAQMNIVWKCFKYISHRFDNRTYWISNLKIKLSKIISRLF